MTTTINDAEVSGLNVRVTRLEGKMDNALGSNY